MNVWSEFSKETNGTFKEGYSWNSDSSEIEYKNWKIVFDNFTLWSGEHSAQMTRVVVAITLKDNFKFEIYREGFVRKIEKLFEAQDIETGHPDFDKTYTIKSNNEFKVKKLLNNKDIRNLIESQKDVNLQISNQKGIWEQILPLNEFELSYFTDGEIQDLKVLGSLLQLFKVLLDELFQMNSIT